MYRPALLRGSLLVFLAPALIAAGASKQITWGELTSLVTPEHVVRIVLPDSVRVEGRPVDVKADGLVMNVTRTSDKQLHPKGPMTVPRDSVKEVEVRKPRSKGRWIGALAGAAPGIAIMAAGSNLDSEFNIYVLMAAAAATAVGVPVGFFIGRAVDRRFQKFVVAAR